MEKKKILNVLFSTTRQWNPGDEFILLGCINLLKKYYTEEMNLIIYNRNPQIRIEYGRREIYKKFGNISLFKHFKDNSIHKDLETKFIDLAVFAGSPEWFGKRTKEFYDICLKNNIPTIVLGVGLNGKEIKLKNYEKELLKKTKLITVRDKFTEKFLSDFNATFVPCPALFSSLVNREVKEVKKIGLIYATSKTERANNIDIKTNNYIKELYSSILKKYDSKYKIEFIGHYIGELPEFYKEYPNKVIRYSYDSKDYLEIYNKYDLIIGTRVHGIGIGASLGIPGIMIGHDERANTVKGFLGEMATRETPIEIVLELIENTINDINVKSRKLLEHKLQIENIYKEKIKRVKEEICQY